MNLFCVNSCVIVLLSLCFHSTNGQTTTVSSKSKQLTTDSKPVTINKLYQTEGFNNDSITSGPLLVIDKRTIFISDLNYDNEGRDTYFWTGVGDPSSNGTLVPDENNSTSPLKSYQRQNIYLQLPENVTTDTIDYIAVWSVENKTDLAHILLYKGNDSEARYNVPEALGYHNKTKDNKTIFRIPSYCGINEIFPDDSKTCTPVETDLIYNFTVFESNDTHIEPEHLLKDIEFVPYKYHPQCPSDSIRIVLDEKDALGLIYNSSLLYYLDHEEYGVLSHGMYCIIYTNITVPKFAACIRIFPDTQNAGIHVLYLPCLIISTICFCLSAGIYIFILKAKDIHKKCFVGYSISMVVTFLSLICLQYIGKGCNFTGGLFMFSMICSFVWLACLCVDLIWVVKSLGHRTEDNTRIYIYLSVSMAVPVIILLSSLIPDGVPDIPPSFVKTGDCNFGDVNIGIFLVPIGLLISVSVVGLGYTSYLINTHHKDQEDYEWIRNKSHFKFMLIQCMLICAIMTISSVVWLVVHLLKINGEPEGVLRSLSIIESLQGVLFVLIIFGHSWGHKVIEQRKCKNDKNNQFCNCETTQNGNCEIIPLNGRGKDLTLLE